MNLFPSSWELYSHLFFGKFFYIPRSVLYPGIKFSKFVTNIAIHISIFLFPGIYKYISIFLFLGIYKFNLKQTHLKGDVIRRGCLMKKETNIKRSSKFHHKICTLIPTYNLGLKEYLIIINQTYFDQRSLNY